MKKRKKGFGYYLYAFLAFGFFIANIIMILLLVFYVREIDVKGNDMVDDSEIVRWVKEDEYSSNSLYALWKYNHYSGPIPDSLEAVNVRMVLPWKLQVTVTEKQAIAVLKEEGAYVAFDREGMVLSRTALQPEGLMVVEGIPANETRVHDLILVEDKHVFSYVEELAFALGKYELIPDKLVWDEQGMNAYYDDVYVKFGKSGFDDKVLQLSAILEKVEGKKGILHLEHYNETNESITFEKNS